MAVLRRPARPFSFYQHQLERAHGQTVPGERLDEVLNDIIEAIASTQEALAQIRRDDGALTAGSVGKPQLTGDLLAEITQSFELKTNTMLLGVRDVMSQARIDVTDVALRAQDAERAATVAMQSSSKSQQLADQIQAQIDAVASSNDSVEMFSTEAEDWANYSHAQADNAIKAKDEALQWAEYLAGPVVNSQDAPAYIAGSKWPNGLY